MGILCGLLDKVATDVKVMMKRITKIMSTVADQFAEILAMSAVKRIYGVVGDSLNGITDSIRRQGKIEWIHVHHEEAAAFAAGAEAQLTGSLAVCAGSCGPGKAVIGGRAGEVLDLAVTNLWR